MDTRARIFELLDRQGMEQKAFAEAVGTKEATVSDWRRGKSNSYNRYLVKIAQVLGTTTADLLGEEKEKATRPQEGNGLHAKVDQLHDPKVVARAEEYLDFLISLQDKP